MAQVTISRKKTLTRHLAEAQPDLVPWRQARAAYTQYRADLGYKTPSVKMMSWPGSIYKLDLSSIPSIGFTGAPARMAGFESCANRSPSCTKVCIRYTGQMQFPYQIQVGVDRTRFLWDHPTEAVSLMFWETLQLAEKAGQCAWRGNVDTDVAWEEVAGWIFTEWRDRGATVHAYDYTKDWDRVSSDLYHLTYSATENHSNAEIADRVASGRNVAVVFAVPKGYDYPAEWNGCRVIDGDKYDERCFDPAGRVVALYAKGKAKKLTPGADNAFVRTIG